MPLTACSIELYNQSYCIDQVPTGIYHRIGKEVLGRRDVEEGWDCVLQE